MLLALKLVALAVITSCNYCGTESVRQGKEEPFNPSRIILSILKAFSNVVGLQGRVLTPGEIREKPRHSVQNSWGFSALMEQCYPFLLQIYQKNCHLTTRSWFLLCLFLLYRSSATYRQRPRFIRCLGKDRYKIMNFLKLFKPQTLLST